MIRSAAQRGLSGIAGFAFISLSALVFSSPVQAQDYTLGGDARAFAMGGAGIAILNPSAGSRVNPASLAFERKDVYPNFPSLGLRSNNIDVNATSYLVNGMKNSDAVGIARQFGKSDADFAVNGNAALRFGKFEIGANAVGIGRLQPNSELQQWVRTGARDLRLLDLKAQGDIFGAGYYTLPSVAMAGALPVGKKSKTSVGVGLRVKYMRAMYSHYIADYDALAGEKEGLLAPEMGGQNTLNREGLGADLGIMTRTRTGLGFSSALVVTNAVRPNFSFEGTDRNGNKTNYNLLQTNVSAGVGYTGKATTIAADAVNLNGVNGGVEFRTGAEHRITRTIAVRAGYSNKAGNTWGFSFFGFDAAFGKKVPLEVVRTINF